MALESCDFVRARYLFRVLSPNSPNEPERSISFYHHIMPPAIISPSVLASDFGQLTAECKRMLRGGAQWLHMGTLHSTWWGIH